jgi:hypothetical protein
MADLGGEEVFLRCISIRFNFVAGLKTFYMKIVGMGIMRNSIQIKLFDIFRKDLHLADERAHELVQTIGQAVKGEYEDNLEGVATKEFVKDEIQASKQLVKDEIQATKQFVKEEIQVTKQFVKDEIQVTKQFVKDEIHVTKQFVRDEIQATKEFVRDEIHVTKEFVRERFHTLDLKIEQVKSDLELKIEQTRSDLTKAIFISNLIQFLAIVGSVIAIINFMRHQ